MTGDDSVQSDAIDMDASRDKQGKVPIEELEALADAWESKGKGTDLDKVCAQELREVIENHE